MSDAGKENYCTFRILQNCTLLHYAIFLPRCRKPKKKKNLLMYCGKMVDVAGVLNQTFGKISSL